MLLACSQYEVNRHFESLMTVLYDFLLGHFVCSVVCQYFGFDGMVAMNRPMSISMSRSFENHRRIIKNDSGSPMCFFPDTKLDL
jgi:hypothetical protein